jgi:hypothetical protein
MRRPGERGHEGVRFLTMEFHISRKVRERYGFAESLFSYNGNVIRAPHESGA